MAAAGVALLGSLACGSGAMTDDEINVVVRHPHVEHWLNGVKVVEYELGSADWEARVQAGKFAAMPRYGRNRSGHIALQDHGDLVGYRHIRIRPL